MRKHLYIIIILALLLSMTAALTPGGSVSTAQAGVGDLVPLGDQLGDVGQYYSSALPSGDACVYIFNYGSSSETVNVKIYNDIGTTVEEIQCTLPPKLTMLVDTYSSSVSLQGSTSAISCTNGYNNDLHGVHHMKIEALNNSNAQLAVSTWLSSAVMFPKLLSYSAYEAVPDSKTDDEFYIPVFGAWRNANGQPTTDTEVTVYNAGAYTEMVKFQIRADNNGYSFDNNAAEILSGERRTFLASQLLYDDNNGSLIPRSGWHSARVYAADGNAKLAVMSTLYRHKTAGKAEDGVQALISFSPSQLDTELFVPLYTPTGNHYARVTNTFGGSTTVTVKVYDTSGTEVASRSFSLDAYQTGIICPYGGSGSCSTTLPYLSSSYSLRVYNSYNYLAGAHWMEDSYGAYGESMVETNANTVVAFPSFMKNNASTYSNWAGLASRFSAVQSVTSYLQDDTDGSTDSFVHGNRNPFAYTLVSNSGFAGGATGNGDHPAYSVASGSSLMGLQTGYTSQSTVEDNRWAYNGSDGFDNVWYVPFAPAPVVAYREPTSPIGVGGRSDSYYNSGATYPADMRDWPEITWGGATATCGASDNDLIQKKSAPTLRNTVRSSCVGHPLVLMNEPGNDTPNGGYDKDHEFAAWKIAREVFLHRGWPGSLQGISRSTHLATSYSIDRSTIYPQYPSFENVEHEYGKIIGDSTGYGKLPLDTISLHTYVGFTDIDISGNIASGTKTLLQGIFEDWRSEMRSRYGSGISFSFPEMGISANENQTIALPGGGTMGYTSDTDPWALSGQSAEVRKYVRLGAIDLYKLIDSVFSGIFSNPDFTNKAPVTTLHWFPVAQRCHGNESSYTPAPIGRCLDAHPYVDSNNAVHSLPILNGLVGHLTFNSNDTILEIGKPYSGYSMPFVVGNYYWLVNDTNDHYQWTQYEAGQGNVASSIYGEMIKITADNGQAWNGISGWVYQSYTVARAQKGTSAYTWENDGVGTVDDFQSHAEHLHEEQYHHDATVLIGTWVDEIRGSGYLYPWTDQPNPDADDDYGSSDFNDLGACIEVVHDVASSYGAAPTSGICFDTNSYGVDGDYMGH